MKFNFQGRWIVNIRVKVELVRFYVWRYRRDDTHQLKFLEIWLRSSAIWAVPHLFVFVPVLDGKENDTRSRKERGTNITTDRADKSKSKEAGKYFSCIS